MTKRKESIGVTARQLLEALKRDPVYMRRKAERERRRALVAADLEMDESSLVAELADVGVAVRSVWDLVNTPGSYPAAIDVLARHLRSEHLPRTREGIARALTVKEARGIAGRSVLEALMRSSRLDESEVRWALANALTVIADQSLLSQIKRLYDSGQYPNEARELRAAIKRASKVRRQH